MRDELRRLVPLLTWGATLAAAIVLFTLLGNGELAAPPLTEPGAWGDWLGDREPIVATVALLRLLVLAMAWYLVGVTTIGAVARLADIAALVRVADALSIPIVRRVLQNSLGVGLATAVVSSAVGPAVVAQPATPADSGGTVATAAALADDRELPAPPGMQVLDADDTSTIPPSMQALDDAPGMQALDDDAGAPPRMQALDPAATDGTLPPPPGMRPLPDPELTPAPEMQLVEDPVEVAPPVDEVPPEVAAEYTVVSGDHLWSIAEAHLARMLGGTPADADVADYWDRLVDANRDRLVDRDNPDLIVPGQTFVLPDVEAPA